MKVKAHTTTRLRTTYEHNDTDYSDVQHAEGSNGRSLQRMAGFVGHEMSSAGMACEERLTPWKWVVEALEKYSGVMPSTEQEERPEVLYKPYWSSPIEVGKCSWVVPINHYNASLVTNTGPVLTGVVLAHDKVSGAFETRRTRYVLDIGYEH